MFGASSELASVMEFGFKGFLVGIFSFEHCCSPHNGTTHPSLFATKLVAEKPENKLIKNSITTNVQTWHNKFHRLHYGRINKERNLEDSISYVCIIMSNDSISRTNNVLVASVTCIYHVC